MQQLYLLVPLAPLAAAVVVGLFGARLGRACRTGCAALGVGVSMATSYVMLPRRAGGPCIQRRCLHLAADGELQAHHRLPDRSTVDDDDARRHLRVADGPYLYDRVHGRRPRLHAIFQLHLALHVFDADAGDEQQLSPALLRLGGGRPRLLSADRLLVRAAVGHLRESQGVHRQPCRRFRLRARDRADPRVLRHARLCLGVRRRGEFAGRPSTCGAPHRGRSSRSSASASSSARWARARKCRCTFGCPTRWKARRRSPR